MTTLEELQHAAETYDLARVDHSIAAWIRQYSHAEVEEWMRSENTLMRILLNAAIISPEAIFPTDGVSDDVANAIARAIGNCDREAPYSTGYLKTLSALAFGAAGNFSCASILARKRLNDPNLGLAEQWMMRVLSSRRLDFAQSLPPRVFVNYARLVEHALADGRQEDFDESTLVLQAACLESLDALTSTDKYLLLFWRQIHKRFEELSAARLLKQRDFPNQAYIL